MEIRIANLNDAAAIAEVHVNSWKTTYQSLVSEVFLNNLDVQVREARWRKSMEEGNKIFVAVNEQNRIVGFANGGENRSKKYHYDGELYAIYILEEAQGMGAGKHLICHVAEQLKKDGFHSMVVWVLNGNPASQFYQHFNPIRVAEEETMIGGKVLRETAFGWEDLTSLLTYC
ncbi:GNAT family N-acetyltransferase [Pseudalkalibacillus hwajinpoensis]|uniref:GNAT family N-acetyltransferase n=1 Tax=Guptibacillus hwajinpoensis TaxID=208199 RepID=UPI00325A65B4